MTASSTARSRTILRVTVPMPAEFSVKTPSFNGFAFMGSYYRHTDLELKLARSSASSQSNVVVVSGFSPSLEQFSMK
jgi:hypothetical protein